MATLKVVFKAIDEISSKFNEMTQSGERALEAFENTGTAADGALSKVSRTAAQTAKSTDAAADSVDGLSSAIWKRLRMSPFQPSRTSATTRLSP